MPKFSEKASLYSVFNDLVNGLFKILNLKTIFLNLKIIDRVMVGLFSY